MIISRAGQQIEFNINKSEVIKYSTNDYDEQLQRQFDWLQYFKDNPSIVNAKKIVKKDNKISLIMDYIEGIPLHREIIESINNQVFQKVESALRILFHLHKSDSFFNKIDINDIFEHYIKKTIDRYNTAKFFIPCLQKKYFLLNKVLINNPYLLIIKQQKEIANYLFNKCKTGIIHGDPNFSNIMWDISKKIPIFIDPRGLFGKHKLIGDIYYDLAKVLYSFDGFCDIIEKHGILNNFNTTS
ncbi:Aminoglycoside phosphotransferase domain protein, partial [Candidatus Magnetomorum sp. HK-1]